MHGWGRRAARRVSLHDHDAGGAGGSCHSGAGSDPPLSLRRGSRRGSSSRTGGPATRIRSSTHARLVGPPPICPTTRPFTGRRSRLWRRSRSGFCSRSATPIGRSRSSGRCPRTSTWRPGCHDDVARLADVVGLHGGFGSTLGALAQGRRSSFSLSRATTNGRTVMPLPAPAPGSR